MLSHWKQMGFTQKGVLVKQTYLHPLPSPPPTKKFRASGLFPKAKNSWMKVPPELIVKSKVHYKIYTIMAKHDKEAKL